MQGSDFHVPGKNYIAQPGGQVGGGGCPIGTSGGRRPPLGGVQPIRSSATLYTGINSNGQTILGNSIPTPIQGTSITTGPVLHSSSEMGKQTHLQTQPPAISQVYAQNPSRSASQNNYYTTPRPQQSRNINHRSAQSANQTQVVGIPGAGNGQPPTMYPHSSIAMSPVYVQNQVSGLQPSPHQQNVYPMNNQMSMQFTGPPQRHQTHQNQFSYQSYQAHALFTPSNIFSAAYAHGPQPGYYYHQPPSAQLNMRSNANNVGNNNQHVPTSLNSGQATALVSQGSISQQPQVSQAMHTISMSIPQTDIYTGFNSGNPNVSTRSVKKRTKAITDIVNPLTGRNISDEIYKDDTTNRCEDIPNKDNLHTTDCNAELVADFAARVAKLASESSMMPSVTCAESSADSQILTQNPLNKSIQNIDSKKHSTLIEESNILDKDTSILTENKDTTCTYDGGILPEQGKQSIITSDSKTFGDTLTSCIIQNVLQNDISSECKEEKMKAENIERISTSSQEITLVTNEKIVQQSISAILYATEVNVKSVDNRVSENIFAFKERHNDEENIGKENEQSDKKNLQIDVQKDVTLLNSSDGKAMQKQKCKSKVKTKDLNRKSIEKEISDMDLSVKQIQDTNPLIEIEVNQNVLTKELDEKENVEVIKDGKDKDNYESKKEQNIQKFNAQYTEGNIISSSNTSEKNEPVEKQTGIDELSSEITVKKDVDNIIFFSNKTDAAPLLSIVAQKNDENNKVSELLNSCKDVENYLETVNLNSTIATATTKNLPSLKYTYSDDQWSPINTNGKKVYDRDFLMKLQNDPNSKIKPINLPDLDVVLKDISKIRNSADQKIKEVNLNRHDSLFPGFIKIPLNPKTQPQTKKNHSGKLKSNKPSVIHVSLSLREDVKLRETENAWKPTRLMQTSVSEEQNKTEALYKRVRSVLNKLTPQKFDTLVQQVRDLQIDTQERLQGVIDLVFEKAVDEPNFSIAYALMCKELSNMQVTNGDSKDGTANFRKLILTRCQTEFEKNTVDENAQSEKLREIEECTDPEKKKELQIILEEEERRMRVKSVGNIRFIGELFKQNMLTCKIMHQCIRHLLHQQDEENLECLCKLLTTIGKVLDSKNIDLSEYFNQMDLIAHRKGKISSRIRFMLQDVIDLRTNKWIPRRDDSNPKTIDQIQKEAESERLDTQLSNTSMNTPRKDDRANERKRNRGGPGLVDDGWSQPVGRTRQVYSVETAKLKNKPPSIDDMQLGSRTNYQWAKPSPKMTTPNKFCYLENAPESDKKVPIHLSGSRSTGPREYNRVDYKTNYVADRTSRNISFQSNSNNQVSVEGSRSHSLSIMSSSNIATQNNPINSSQLSEDEFKSLFNKFFEEYISGEEDMEEAAKIFKESFPVSSHINFIREIINAVLEKSEHHLRRTSQLLQQILSNKFLDLQHFKDGLAKILEETGDLIIDIPKLWKYFAKILVYPIISNDFSLNEMKFALQLLSPKLRSDGEAAEFLAELLSEMNAIKGSTWTAQQWMLSGVQWNDFSDNLTKINCIVAEYKLEFLKSSNKPSENYTNNKFNIDKIHDELVQLLKDNEFDDVCNWIQVHIKDEVKEPKFIRTLMTAILESSVEQCSEKWIFKTENFDKLQKLIQRYVDADDFLELQCLFAVQAYITKLNHPAGLLVKIMNHLCENNVLSNEAFLAWEKNKDPAEREGKSVALFSLKSFFTLLQEVDVSSGEEA